MKSITIADEMAARKSAKKKKNNTEIIETSATSTQHGLYRSETNKIVAGVAGGLGEYFSIDPNIIRILFVVVTIFGGSGIIIYLLLWLIMPSPSQQKTISHQTVHNNIQEVRDNVQKFAHDIRRSSGSDNKKQEESRFWFGVIIVVLGGMFLLNNLGFYEFYNIGKLWPLIFIVAGLMILSRK